jgi:hypothetical protein
MGSPPGEVDREPLKMDETQHARRIGRSFEIASKEVTIDQFLRSRLVPDNDKPVRMDKPYPMTEVTFYAAAKYCRWISDREGIPEEEMCYPKAEEIKHGFQMVPGYLSRTGYRLPTEAEWEAACRAGTTTSRFYGSDSSLLYRYAWSTESSGDRLHPVGETMPNPLGLFDMLGNVYEHCLGPDPRTEKYPRGPVDDIERNVGLPKTIFDPTFIAIRGGAYHRSNEASRAACRNGDHANHPNIRIGFRVVRTLRTFASPEK